MLQVSDLESLVRVLNQENYLSKGQECLAVLLTIQAHLAQMEQYRPGLLKSKSYGTVRYGFVSSWTGELYLLLGGSTYGTQTKTLHLKGFEPTGSAEVLASQGGINVEEVTPDDVKGHNWMHINAKRLEYFRKF